MRPATDTGGQKKRSDPGRSTLDFLVRRIQHTADLPAFSKIIMEINEKTSPSSANYASASELANTILKDYSLTNKLLRLVNSAYYGQTAGKVTTVSRAVVILGFEQVRMAASSILLFEHLQDKSSSKALKEEAINALMGGLIAREISALTGFAEVEEAFICSMLHNLGKILVIFYLPEEYERIESLKSKKEIDERLASRAVLGLSYTALGRGIAKSWKFPEKILHSMGDLPKGKVGPAKSEEDALLKLSCLSNEICHLFKAQETLDVQEELTELMGRYGACLPLAKEQLDTALNSAIEKINQYSEILEVSTSDSPLIGRLYSYSKKSLPIPEGDTIEIVPSGKEERKKEGLEIENRFFFTPESGPEQPDSLLIAGIEEVSALLLGGQGLRDVLTAILETMYRGFCFHRVLLCLANKAHTKMVARFGFGPDIGELMKGFRFPITKGRDIFNLAVEIGKDIRIDDTHSPRVAKRIPQWYRRTVFARAFVIFPVVIDGKTVGMFYADREKPGKVIDDLLLDYMRTLRNQATLAIMRHYSPLH
ncbi:MAG: HDOD domain-containing protein [Deltaproteobacteria bacterium]|nr:HDOD domain-containing protein [Deltaproteobacteria bacterium]MBW1929041.1 HDOD domain-containing protein [Deltaproteobacteria bacterium]MBW2024574.1 HDOD domain-containing protein [Deltaproteobacteria bacterium]MBW2125374.1 HDOD domain-containing protein [Deltaproteobacteria bacterium]RLB23404.1 MAG: serine/threonine protein kinase [Deltaproteobacteria bacterium]